MDVVSLNPALGVHLFEFEPKKVVVRLITESETVCILEAVPQLTGQQEEALLYVLDVEASHQVDMKRFLLVYYAEITFNNGIPRQLELICKVHQHVDKTFKVVAPRAVLKSALAQAGVGKVALEHVRLNLRDMRAVVVFELRREAKINQCDFKLVSNGVLIKANVARFNVAVEKPCRM